MLRVKDWDKNFENGASRKLKRLDWVPVPIRMDGAGYTGLVAHEHGAQHFGAWMAIVEIAAAQEWGSRVTCLAPLAIGPMISPASVPHWRGSLGWRWRYSKRRFHG